MTLLQNRTKRIKTSSAVSNLFFLPLDVWLGKLRASKVLQVMNYWLKTDCFVCLEIYGFSETGMTVDNNNLYNRYGLFHSPVIDTRLPDTMFLN